jgi:hypothetical protein
MAHNINPQAKNAILSILLESKQSGSGKVTRTALIKYVYLLDYWMAEETGGNTFTGVEWRFYHFGPYSDALAADLEWLSTQPSVEKEDFSGKDKDYSLYGLGEWAKAQTFEALGLPIDVRLRLTEAIKRYAVDLSGLLDFVYFKTTPMQGATPGTVLSFAGLRKLNFKADIKPVKVPIPNATKAARIKILLSKIGGQWEDARKAPVMAQPPIRDAVFAQTVEDEGLFGAESTYMAALSFHGENV